jgi:hypothetical protein
MLDIKGAFEVSFLTPTDGAYIALFCGEDGVEYKAAIRYGRVRVPRELLCKEQYVGLIAAETDGERVVRSWECEPLRVTAFLYLRQTQWQVSGGMTDKNCLGRLAELESVHAKVLSEFDALKADASKKDEKTRETLSLLRETVAKQAEETAIVKEQNKVIADGYNKAVGAINTLSKRLEALEKNYDPTIID